MDQKKIDRISELGRKSRTAEGLTEEECLERAALREEYRRAVVGNLERELSRVVIVDEQGNRRKLEKKEESSHGRTDESKQKKG
ncbi:MAG: DUF896 domain-containing protein [Oscillibacter sp.]|jgi:uncharacterized protein YnzC (UPF0291/DUF896 family)|nr:DUF896 domain-containing protein [Oscillibacter sp.]